MLERYVELSFCGCTPTRPRDVSRLYDSTKMVREKRRRVTSRRVGGAVQLRMCGIQCKSRRVRR